MTEDPQTINYAIGDEAVSLQVSNGPSGLVVTRVTVESPTGVTNRMLRSIPTGEILANLRVKDAARLTVTGPLSETSGRTAMTDELLQQVALVFIEETGPGKDKRAIQRTAERFGRPEGTVRTWVSRARKDGWLAPGSKGRIGGEPGPRLAGRIERQAREGTAT
jgi:transposase-like protein